MAAISSSLLCALLLLVPASRYSSCIFQYTLAHLFRKGGSQGTPLEPRQGLPLHPFPNCSVDVALVHFQPTFSGKGGARGHPWNPGRGFPNCSVDVARFESMGRPI